MQISKFADYNSYAIANKLIYILRKSKTPFFYRVVSWKLIKLSLVLVKNKQNRNFYNGRYNDFQVKNELF